METLTVDGGEYVKASKIARDLGYTSDYVGQLCRAGKVTAQLVGRSWYVERDSILAHKENRYRSTQAKSVQELKKRVDSASPLEVVTDALKDAPKPHFFTHSKLKPVSAQYQQDETELMPATDREAVKIKSGDVSVGLADALTVAVSSKSALYDFHTPNLPKLRFKGKLKVSGLPEESDAEDATELESPKQQTEPAVERKKREEKLQPEKLRIHTSGVIGMKRKVVAPKSVATELVVPVSATVPIPHAGTSWYVIVTTSVVGVLITIALLGLESHVTANTQAVSSSFIFEIKSAVASVYGSL